ncbi:MAG: putative spermidine/putrescine transport system ATP-binding protein [Alphaproteobacteria bacterium]|nr:putative spermidine/putrescine transport system ATP-binding protein [Alphaproteobacteria bacterium]
MTEFAAAAMASGAQLRLRQLTKAFGASQAVDRISLDVPAGAFVSLLGPSGSGKTTTLNLIAGFLTPDAGDILLDERAIADVPPHKRNIGMVFQSYSLFPHMTVAENVGFPLRMRTRLSRQEARQRIDEMLALVQLGHLGTRYPRQLSGGQQQRVAMARALVSHPRLLLMDEPLGALDKKLREQMQVEIKRIHRSVGTTVIYVTHDQTEALTMSDLVVVMHQARVSQVGTPRVLYEAPANLFVADFLGDSNLLTATIAHVGGDELAVELGNGEKIRAARGTSAAAQGSRTVVLIRPEDISVTARDERTAGQDVVAGTIRDISYHGDTFKLDVALGADMVKVKVPRERGAGMEPGQKVFLTWHWSVVRLLPAADRTSDAGGEDAR